jgi:hypothetical protein
LSRLFSSAFPKLSGVTVALTLALTGTLVHADAATTSLNWVQVTPTQAPSGRAFAAMSYDSLRGRTVLFGGGPNVGPNFSDTWEWDGTTWTLRTPAVSPPGLVGAAMVFDTGLGRSVLFGGATGPGVFTSDTWEWDGTVWTRMSLAMVPPARMWHAMVYDSARNRVVLFGGTGPSGLLGDTWQFDGTSWTQLETGISPSPRYGEGMAFDSIRNRIVLFGGHDNMAGRLGDTWELDGATWAQLSSSPVPYLDFFHSMAFDVQEGKTVLFGGDHLSPFILGSPFTLGPINDTWEWDGSQWTREWPYAAPSPRAGQSMVYDSGRGRIVLFGGTNETFSQVFYNDTWELGSGIATLPGSPAAVFNPSGVGFDTVNVGSTSNPQATTIFNSGTGPLLMTSISTTGDFAIPSTDCPIAPNALAAGSYCVVTLAFSPTAIGNRFGSLVLTDNGPNGTQTMWLQATGIGNPSTLAVNSTTATFGGTADITARLTTNGTPVSGAAVTFTLPNGVSATVQTDSQGIALWSAASLAGIDAGSYPGGIQASFAGNQTLLGTSASATLTVINDTDLALTGVPGNITVNATDPSGAVVTYTAPTAADEAGDSSVAAVSCAPASGFIFAIGTTTVTCTATDADDTAGTASQSFTVTVLDTDLALTGVPDNITVNATSPSGAAVTYAAPTVVDEAGDSSAAAVSCAPASGSTFAIGATTVTCTATDADDTPRTASQTFTVTVLDTDLALTGGPGNITVNATDPSGAVVTYTAPTALDEAADSPAAAVSCAPASGSTFAVGTTTVTCMATSADDSPATVSGTFTVTVLVDLNLAVSVTPSTATTGTVVTGSVSLTNSGSVSRTVTLVATFSFVSPTGAITASSTKAIIKLDAGQTATRSFTFKVLKSSPRGAYSFTSTASDVTGSVSSAATFNVT